jgi:hypothetical protein
MRTKFGGVLAAMAAVLAATVVSLQAHHAFSAEFDSEKPVTFKGTISKVEWTNPHVWMHLDVKGKNGTTESWAFEAGTPSVLFRRGVTKESVKIGMEVTVDGYQAKDGSHRANGRDLKLADGRTMFLGSAGTGAPYEISPTTPPQK